MNDLREDLDRALRTVTFGEAPVERARRAGRRLRNRRRLAAVASVLVVAGVAAGYPALARDDAAARPSPLVGSAKPTPGRGHDMVVTAGPPGQTTEAAAGLTDKTGQIAEGAVGDMKWQVAVVPPGQKNPVSSDSCFVITINVGASDIMGSCNDIPARLGVGLGDSKPAAFTELDDNGTTVTTVGEVEADLAFFIVTFADGQQLKLLPVTVGGHRYVAWMAPLSLTIDSVVAHLGGPYFDSGASATAVPYEPSGQQAAFGAWQQPGQRVPARASGRIGGGVTAGHVAWSATGYVGPWGACMGFSASGSSSDSYACIPLTSVRSLAFLGPVPFPVPGLRLVFAVASAGVAKVRITLIGGKVVTARPVTVGGERLFAVAVTGSGGLAGWTMYDAAGHQVGSGSTASSKP